MKRLSIVSMAVSVSSALRPNGAARAADQIYACVNNSSGAVKLVAQNTTCKNNETLAGWTNCADSGDCGQVFRLIADSDSDRSRTAFR